MQYQAGNFDCCCRELLTVASDGAACHSLHAVAHAVDERCRKRKSRPRPADLYEDAPCGYNSSCLDGTILRIDRTELMWLGNTPQEFVDKRKLAELASVRFYSEHKQAIEALIAGGRFRD